MARRDFPLLAIQISKRFDRLDLQTQQIVSALASNTVSSVEGLEGRVVDRMSSLAQLLSRIEHRNELQYQQTQKLFAHALDSSVGRNSKLFNIDKAEEIRIRNCVGRKILKNIYFKTISSRIEQVAEAYHKTFHWIFDESKKEQPPWANLSEWLRRGEGMYWVNGKAGSGKSTLLRFIYEDIRTKQCLKEWACGVPLHLGHFFFWNSGTSEQKSQHGLLRTLLFDILNAYPDLIPIVLPSMWGRVYSQEIGLSSGYLKSSWSLKSLKAAFQLLVGQTAVPLKLCLLIDGLDEFEGDPEELSEIFKAIKSTHVKVCVSSRPWVVFKDSFQSLPYLRLQDLTRPDIEHYVSQSLARSEPFQRLAMGHPLATTAFIQEIVEKADGVFLWVVLVVRSLLTGIRNRDDIPDLQQRLRRIPEELEPLYNHLLSLIEPVYLPWASRAFQILQTVQQLRISSGSYTMEGQIDLLDEQGETENVQNLTVLGLYLAQNEEVSISIVSNWTMDIIESKCEDTEFHLTARCAGLLETSHIGLVGPDVKIQYLHRTVRDFLLARSVWDKMSSHTPVNTFSPHLSILRSRIMQTRIGVQFAGGTSTIISKIWLDTPAMLIHAHLSEREVLKPSVDLMDSLETVLSQVAQARDPTDSGKLTWSLTQEYNVPYTQSFLAIAAIYSLDTYIQGKTLEERKIIFGAGASLLHYAIPRGTQKQRMVSPQSSTIKLLLQTCDVNLTFKGQSPWQQALNYAQSQLAREDISAQIEITRILTDMVRSGADMRVHGHIGFSKYNVYDFLREVTSRAFMDTELEQAVKGLTNEVQRVGQGKGSSTVKEGMNTKNSKTDRLKAWLKK